MSQTANGPSGRDHARPFLVRLRSATRAPSARPRCPNATRPKHPAAMPTNRRITSFGEKMVTICKNTQKPS